MADTTERLDRIEQALATTNEQLGEVNKRLDKHDERFNQIDERFTRIDGRFTQNDGRFAQIDARLNQIAQVQSRHGERLDEIAKAVEPLKDLRDFVERIAHERELRITELEKAHVKHRPEA